jgi:hypothetical protein
MSNVTFTCEAFPTHSDKMPAIRRVTCIETDDETGRRVKVYIELFDKLSADVQYACGSESIEGDNRIRMELKIYGQ